MTSKNERPAFVLCFMADQQGCGFHRIMTPLASLVLPGVVDGRVDMVVWPDEVVVAAKPDVIVWQRQVEDGQIEAIERWKTLLPDTLFVYELDDYLGGIPEASFHASFMPADIEARVRRGLAVCDRTTTTTEPLAEWLRDLGARDVIVIPNALPAVRLKERDPSPRGKIRVGFAGGMSHAGDLELLRLAMTEIGNEVTWVFMGTQPKNPACTIEFHEGTSAMNYLDAMTALDVDLMLAPLEDNTFNRCKSNLRLIEAGAIGASVIAQDTTAYRKDTPPVVAYATTPEDWVREIRLFIESPTAARQRNADALRSWVGQNYTLERRLRDRIKAWLPKGYDWKPSPALGVPNRCVVSCADVADIYLRMPFLRKHYKEPEGLVAACRRALDTCSGVLWLRPATTLDEGSWQVIDQIATQFTDLATVAPLASDGINAFPQPNWTPMPPDASTAIAGILHNRFADRGLTVSAPSGPAVILTRHALSMLGIPDVEGCGGNEDVAILEWGLRATGRRWKHVQAAGAYVSSLAPPAPPSPLVSTRIQARGVAAGLQQPSESLTAAERESVELELLRTRWGGPRPGSMGFGTDYAAWTSLRNAYAGAETTRLKNEPQVRHRFFGQENAEPLSGWFVFSEQSSGAVLYESAGAIFDAAICQADARGQFVVYGDNDSIIGGNANPEFKPDFDLALFLAQDYVTPICAVHANALDHYPLNRNDLYTMLLGTAAVNGARLFLHVPHILGGVPVNTTPEQEAVNTLSRKVAVEAEFGESVKVTAHPHILGCLSVVRDWRPMVDEAPLVSIIIPTLGSGRLIQPCVATILQHTKYPNYEIVVVLNGARETAELTPATAADPRVSVVRYDKEFNWSAINNWAIRSQAKGKFIVTMNDDVCVASEGWLDAMMGYAVLDGIGAVGAKLIHPMGVLQHVGVICHRGIADHMHLGLPNGQAGHLGRAMLTHEATAVTGACMLFSRENFSWVGGFDETFPAEYNDTVFCLALRHYSLRNVVEVTAELLHTGGTTRGSSPQAQARMIADRRRMADLVVGDDPYWSPNISIRLGQNGALQGLNGDMLAWEDPIAKADSERVLIVNDLPGDQGLAISILKDGGIPLTADLSGFHLRLTAPQPLNVTPWDIRRPTRLAEAIRTLGISRIIIRSLVGTGGAAPPVEALRALAPAMTGVPLGAYPCDVLTFTPWLFEGMFDGVVDVFGHVDMKAWQQAYEETFPTTPEGYVETVA